MKEERRAAQRFPLNLKLHYTCVPTGPSGAGETINIGGGRVGLLFTASHPLAVGQSVDLRIDWPLLKKGRALELVILGPVIRTENRPEGLAIAVRISRIDLRDVRRAGGLSQEGHAP